MTRVPLSEQKGACRKTAFLPLKTMLMVRKSGRGVYPPRAYGRHRSVSTDIVAGVYPPRAYGRHRSVSTDIGAGVNPPRCGTTRALQKSETISD